MQLRERGSEGLRYRRTARSTPDERIVAAIAMARGRAHWTSNAIVCAGDAGSVGQVSPNSAARRSPHRCLAHPALAFVALQPAGIGVG
jgi:hypothetical protein